MEYRICDSHSKKGIIMLRKTTLTTCALALVLAASPAAFAEKGGNGKGHGKNKSHHSVSQHVSHSSKSRVRIDSSDRVVIREYIEDSYYDSCPPGLAKKHNGCLPPGQAKKRYSIGRPLPDYIVYEPVPDRILYRLEPVPVGYRYVRVDTDVLLISEASKKVIDAVTLLSAVGN
jgi:Ni/Co efflux regulator RcnB